MVQLVKESKVKYLGLSLRLGHGSLSGGITSLNDLAANDFRRALHRYSPKNFPKNLEFVQEIKELETKKSVTITQVVLVWALSQGQDFIAIPRTRDLKYFEDNINGGGAQVTG
ncbi:hypothetical protein BJV82DRAFT_679682 [Fennellomyces sp. T-0311]|nr:hypothetical protein BJV82DRAFT_679682 [Fennellomyces sp. T-0311]